MLFILQVSILSEQTICSDRILTCRIKSRIKLKRDGDPCGLPEAYCCRSQEDVAEDWSHSSPHLSSVEPGHQMLGAEEEKESNIT